MMKKTIILGILVCSLLLASTISVKAEDDIKILDGEGDVLDDMGDVVNKKDIDIVEVTCNKDGGTIELKLKLVDGGIIQDSMGYSYYIELATSKDYYYSASFEEGECSILDENLLEIEGANPVCSGAGTNTLTITFQLIEDDDTPLEITALTAEVDWVNSRYFLDSTDIEMSLIVDTGGPYTGKVGESIRFTGSVEGGSSPYEWQWSIDEEDFSTDQNPTHIFNEAGEYAVTLYVMDENFNFGISETIVTILPSTDEDDGESSGLIMFIAIIAIIVIAGVAVLIFALRR